MRTHRISIQRQLHAGAPEGRLIVAQYGMLGSHCGNGLSPVGTIEEIGSINLREAPRLIFNRRYGTEFFSLPIPSTSCWGQAQPPLRGLEDVGDR